MSIRLRRTSLRKSSIGIDSIRKSITNLSEGLVSIGKQSSELLKETRKSNLFKSTLIRQDAEFFKKRRENALRKQREDELEASTVTGVTKRQGNLAQKSTKGFLGRILDFVGTLIIGWALINLPKIIEAFKKLFGFIKRIVGVFTAFIDGMRNFFDSIGAGIDNFLTIFNRFDFREDDKNIKETFENTENNLTKLNKDFLESVNLLVLDEDIRKAKKVADDLGIEEEFKAPQEKDFQDLVEDDFEDTSAVEKDEENISEDNSIEDTTTGPIPIITERRNIGGPVEAGQPVIVGDAAGIDSRSSELFVPDVDGRIVSNNELEDVVSSNEGEGELDDLLSELETGEGTSSSSSAPPTSSSGGITLEDEKKSVPSMVRGIKTPSDVMSIIPMSLRKEINLKAPKKIKKMIMMGGNNQMPPQLPSMPTKSSVTKIVNKGSSLSELILLTQSIALSSG